MRKRGARAWIASTIVSIGVLWCSSTVLAQTRPAEATGQQNKTQVVKDWLDELSPEQRQRLKEIVQDDRVATFPAQRLSNTAQQAPDHQDPKCCSQLENAQQQIAAYQRQVHLLEEKIAALEKECKK